MENLKKEDTLNKKENDIVFTKTLKAGKRIYYLDVKKNKKDEFFLAITESKKIISGEDCNPIVQFEKHKIFLYQEDFDKFTSGLNEVMTYIKDNSPEKDSEEKIERPSYYLGKKGLGNHASNYDKENPYMWRGNQVTTLIARPEYIGKTVNFRTFKNSYKDKKTKRADKEDWVVFDDTQEPIVDEETWLLAQKLRQNVRKADPMGEPNVLTGKIYCADCGAPMYNHRQRKGRERIYYTAKGEKRTSYSNPADCYECSTYNLAYQKYDRHCTCHHISTKALKSIILKTIQETCHYVSLNEREFVYSLQEESAMKDIAVSETVKNRIERNQKRVHELDMLIRIM